MKAVKLTKAIASQGLAEGDVLTVDELSAANMIKAGKATEYKPEEDDQVLAEEFPEVDYGGQKVRTIDDIVDPDAKRMKGVMHVQRLVGADPGPARDIVEAESTGDEAADSADGTNQATAAAQAAGQQPPTTDSGKRGKAARGASGADPAGGDATDGGSSTS